MKSIEDSLAKHRCCGAGRPMDSAQCALSALATARKVAQEFGMPLVSLQAFVPRGQVFMKPYPVPDITTMFQVYLLQTELAKRWEKA